MGRTTLIIVLGFILIFGYVRGNMNHTSERAQGNSAELAEAVQARHVTSSAIQYEVHLHTQTGMKDTAFTDTTWLGGLLRCYSYLSRLRYLTGNRYPEILNNRNAWR